MSEIKTNHFSKEEQNYIIGIARKLIIDKNITGVNLIKSNNYLPKSAIIVHFLHDSREHLDFIVKDVSMSYELLPRFTYYVSRPEYFKKPDFKEEYKNAIFLNKYFEEISIDNAISNPYDVTIMNNELDLIIPIEEQNNLSDLVEILRKGNENGPKPWIDPVLIIKTKDKMKLLCGFVNTYFLSVSREKEEFYTIINDKNKQIEIANFLEKECERNCIGTLNLSDIIFCPSQVNKEFYTFIEDNL